MRKVLTIAAFLIAVIIATNFTSCNNQSDKQASTDQSLSPDDSMTAMIKHGEYLAYHVAACMHCHSTRDITKYSGPIKPGTEGGGGEEFSHAILADIPGVLYGKNITPDKETGIGTWTDEELLRAITQGISKNGDTLFPIMPYANFNRMAKHDLLSIIAYIRTLKPINNKVPARELMIPIAMAYPAKYLQPSLDGNVIPPTTDKVKYGEYLATVADCATCHTVFKQGELDFSKLLAGGNTFTIDKWKVTSANLTPDSATGLGTWSEEMFLSKFKQYRDPKSFNYDPGLKNTVMPVSDYAGMKDEDLQAIYAYLRTVKPMSNKVEKYPK